jgi:hypothetical protein
MDLFSEVTCPERLLSHIKVTNDISAGRRASSPNLRTMSGVLWRLIVGDTPSIK